MNWEAIGAIGELLGAVAVVLTLAYLAVQVRQNSENLNQNTRAVIAATEVAGGEQVLQGQLPVAENAELAEILLAGSEDYHALDPVRRLQFSSYWQAALISHQGYFF